jgi:hypothetical protein
MPTVLRVGPHRFFFYAGDRAGMSTSTDEIHVQAFEVTVSRQELTVHLLDGRTIIVPLHWYPRLKHATPKERNNWKLIGSGNGIHWQDLDEDISVRNLLLGQPSGESQKSFERWLKNRPNRKH